MRQDDEKEEKMIDDHLDHINNATRWLLTINRDAFLLHDFEYSIHMIAYEILNAVKAIKYELSDSELKEAEEEAEDSI